MSKVAKVVIHNFEDLHLQVNSRNHIQELKIAG